MNIWVIYEMMKKELRESLYATCKSSEEWQIKYEKGIKEIINLLKI